MLLDTLVLFIEFAVQTIFLTVALWIMIKLQKLDYNFPGLLGSAALVSGLDRILNTVLGHFLGLYLTSFLSAPIVVTVLIFCVSKVTRADSVDVLFTIGVGYALVFGMNLWLFGTLLGDLRPFAGVPEKIENVAPARQSNEKTNEIVQTAIKTHRLAPNVPTNLAAPPKPIKPVEVTTNLFSVKGVSQNASRSAVTIQIGMKTYTILLGESALTQTSNGPVSVRFKELGDGWVVLIIDGQETKLPFH
jgi:hypothetical protein